MKRYYNSFIFFLRVDRQIYLNLQETCKQMKAEIRRMDEQCRVEMEKRFGEGITFADIDSFAVNRSDFT
jgi:hypothetical protein